MLQRHQLLTTLSTKNLMVADPTQTMVVSPRQIYLSEKDILSVKS